MGGLLEALFASRANKMPDAHRQSDKEAKVARPAAVAGCGSRCRVSAAGADPGTRADRRGSGAPRLVRPRRSGEDDSRSWPIQQGANSRTQTPRRGDPGRDHREPGWGRRPLPEEVFQVWSPVHEQEQHADSDRFDHGEFLLSKMQETARRGDTRHLVGLRRSSGLRISVPKHTGRPLFILIYPVLPKSARALV